MTGEVSALAVVIFVFFVAITLGISVRLGGRARSSQGYFTAHGQIPWFVNGVAFAGDYLSAASFLGICGMIAFYGYDGFLYSIGYLAGWIVALFVIAEPMKRLGKFTFADALDAKFQSRAIKLVVGISTLVISLFYLIPQMVGAGALIQPLLGFDHWVGVLIVGATVILIVVSAGMVSTTYVQFLKGALLVVFSGVLVAMLLVRGLKTADGGLDGYVFQELGPVDVEHLHDAFEKTPLSDAEILPSDGPWKSLPFVRVRRDGQTHYFYQQPVAPLADASNSIPSQGGTGARVMLYEAQSLVKGVDGSFAVNGQQVTTKPARYLHPVGYVTELPHGATSTGRLNPLTFLSTIQQSEIAIVSNSIVREVDGTTTTIYYPRPTSGSQILLPGGYFQGMRSKSIADKLNFLSLMLALFCGTASLPHILIRYYTVKDAASARKSTIVGIASIGTFYIFTLYLGLGAMTSGALDPTDTNMAAPLLAKSISPWLFAVISAIAFTTVLGTVSGLILAASGAVTHDLLCGCLGIEMSDLHKVRIAKLTSVVVGAIAVGLGILFKEMNVSYLVGWAFSIAASSNLPALVMLLFWSGTTWQGIVASSAMGMLASLGWILVSAETFSKIYGLPATDAWVPFSQPGIVTIPLSFATLVLVSWMTQKSTK